VQGFADSDEDVITPARSKESLERNNCNTYRLPEQQQRLSVMKIRTLLASFRFYRGVGQPLRSFHFPTCAELMFHVVVEYISY